MGIDSEALTIVGDAGTAKHVFKITCTSGGQAAPRDEVKRARQPPVRVILGCFVSRKWAVESHGSRVGFEDQAVLHYLLTFLRLTFVSLASMAYQPLRALRRLIINQTDTRPDRLVAFAIQSSSYNHHPSIPIRASGSQASSAGSSYSASESALTTAKIPSLNFTGSGSTRRPANIPLHTLERRQRRSSSRDGSWDEKGSEDRRRLRGRSSASEDEVDSDVGSEFSLWSDTGDLVDQLADEEDPLAGHFKADDNYQVKQGRSSQKRQKAVRYASNGSQEKPYTGRNKSTGSTQRPGVVKKEDIYIPSPPSRPLSWGQKFLATIMAPNDGPSRMHGLHGKKLLYFLSIFVSLGVFLFGYDQGVMSGIITGPYFKDYFNQPSRAEIGTMVAILEIGALISSLSVGRIGDVLGRRKTILYGAMVFVVGGACQTFSTGMPMMMLGRFVAGLGVGALSTIVPVYQSEISPPHNRGKLACIEFSGNIFGYMCSVWVDYFCSYIPSDWAWRVPLLLQVVMGGLLAVGSFLIVESPRWLLDNDHDEEGIVVIANLYGKGDIHNPKARDEYREIKMNVLLQRQEGERSYADMFKRYYKRVFIAMSAQALAQLNGINVISYYAPLVFEQAGWVGRDAILMTGINGITYLASTVPPWYVVDRLGRRFILLSGAIAMIISLSAISYFIFIDIHITPTMVVIFVMIYNAAFGYSWGPIPWLYPPEILPLSIRAKGASLSTAANWAFNWLVGEMTPILQEAIKWRLYLVHAFFCAVSFVVVWFIYPETANVRLEDMNSLFGDATTAAPTPQTLAEAESLFSGNRSPIGSFSLGSQQGDGNVPDMDLQPPDVEIQDGKPMVGGKAGDGDSQREGVVGSINRVRADFWSYYILKSVWSVTTKAPPCNGFASVIYHAYAVWTSESHKSDKKYAVQLASPSLCFEQLLFYSCEAASDGTDYQRSQPPSLSVRMDQECPRTPAPAASSRSLGQWPAMYRECSIPAVLSAGRLAALAIHH
ncbi:general substrate transporter [Hortaea werneckii]|nr:general substrate transporter [Hortaea werneckii]